MVDGAYHAFLWQDGAARDLGTLSGPSLAVGGPSSRPWAINDDGVIVGTSNGRAVLWRNGVISDLGSPRGKVAKAAALNDRGQVVGSIVTSAGYEHASLWQNGAMRDLGTLGGKLTYSYANAVNQQGQIIGQCYGASGSLQRAFVWQNGVMSDLTLGGPYSNAVAINERGQIIGRSTTRNGDRHAVLWTLRRGT